MNEKPDFVNEQGVQWFLDQSLNNYAKSKQLKVTCFTVRFPNGRMEYVVVKDGAVIYGRQQREAIAVFLDVLALG